MGAGPVLHEHRQDQFYMGAGLALHEAQGQSHIGVGLFLHGRRTSPAKAQDRSYIGMGARPVLHGRRTGFTWAQDWSYTGAVLVLHGVQD